MVIKYGIKFYLGFFAGILIGVVMLFGVKSIGNSLFEGDALLWFYGVNAQVFAALLAIGGVFIVYKLQDQRMKMRDISQAARATIRRWPFDQLGYEGAARLDQVTDELLLPQLEWGIAQLEKEGQSEQIQRIFGAYFGDALQQLKEAKSTIQQAVKEEKWVKEQRVWPLRLTTLALLASIILLPLHRASIIYEIQGYVFVMVLILSILAIISVGRLIKKMIEGKPFII